MHSRLIYFNTRTHTYSTKILMEYIKRFSSWWEVMDRQPQETKSSGLARDGSTASSSLTTPPPRCALCLDRGHESKLGVWFRGSQICAEGIDTHMPRPSSKPKLENKPEKGAPLPPKSSPHPPSLPPPQSQQVWQRDISHGQFTQGDPPAQAALSIGQACHMQNKQLVLALQTDAGRGQGRSPSKPSTSPLLANLQ